MRRCCALLLRNYLGFSPSNRCCWQHVNNTSAIALTWPLEELFPTILQRLGPVYFVIDALDECPASGGARQDLLSNLGRLLKTVPNLRVLVTSRRSPDIEESVSAWHARIVEINSASVDKDIETYVTSQLTVAPTFRKKEYQACKELITEAIGRGADGMYV